MQPEQKRLSLWRLRAMRFVQQAQKEAGSEVSASEVLEKLSPLELCGLYTSARHKIDRRTLWSDGDPSRVQAPNAE